MGRRPLNIEALDRHPKFLLSSGHRHTPSLCKSCRSFCKRFASCSVWKKPANMLSSSSRQGHSARFSVKSYERFPQLRRTSTDASRTKTKTYTVSADPPLAILHCYILFQNALTLLERSNTDFLRRVIIRSFFRLSGHAEGGPEESDHPRRAAFREDSIAAAPRPPWAWAVMRQAMPKILKDSLAPKQLSPVAP
jgi:hypothetical protein